MTYSIHQTPGRIRISSAAAKNDSHFTRRMGSILKKLDGIHSVRVNPVIGSITVTYDEAVTIAAPIINTLNKHGFLKGIIGFPRSVPRFRRTPSQSGTCQIVSRFDVFFPRVLMAFAKSFKREPANDCLPRR